MTARRATAALTTDSGTSVEGLVVRTEAGFHQVRAGDGLIVCRTPKRLLQGERTRATAIVIGDRVRVRPNDGKGVIEEILTRDNELVRGAAGGSHYLDVIAANLDLLVAVHSLRHPDLNTARLDRFLLIAEAAEIPAMVCLNKLDLASPADTEKAIQIYASTGYPMVVTSAMSGEGVSKLRDEIRGKLAALVGPSGVGKSSLLNAMQPGLSLRTGAISQSSGKGRHVTSTAELLQLNDGGYVADTPGLRELAIREVDPIELEWLFLEFRPHLGKCRFANCTHHKEDGCAILLAVQEGLIAAERYHSYVRVYAQLLEDRPY